MSSALLEMRNISKVFPGVRALSGVDFTVRPGEVHALMGENGAGKSTLVKVLCGLFPAETGTIRFAGSDIAPRTPREAEKLGISTVYQEINLIPQLSVAENLLLGRQPKRLGFLDWKAVRRRARRALSQLGLDIDVTKELSSCSIAIQQMVAIARALDIDAKLLILDEPTSSLDEQEVEELFAVIRRLRNKGLGVIFVTHFLDQVYQISDRITVLRNGELVGEYETASLPKLELIARMLGRDVDDEHKIADHVPSVSSEQLKPFLEVRGLGRKGHINPFDLTLAKGEVLGLAGLLGSGRTEIARLLFGIDRSDEGSISVDGKRAHIRSPRQAIRLHMGFCSEDRKAEGIVPGLSVRENLILALQARQGPLRRLSRKRQLAIVSHYIRVLDIKTPRDDALIENLSGGNQQKVLLARWLAMQPQLIILDEATRGIDVGAKAEIEKLVAELREQGMAILFISSELEEVVRNCQRVTVLRDRKKVGEYSGDNIDQQTIMHTIAATHEQSD